jgi:hypothetical protein
MISQHGACQRDDGAHAVVGDFSSRAGGCLCRDGSGGGVDRWAEAFRAGQADTGCS